MERRNIEVERNAEDKRTKGERGGGGQEKGETGEGEAESRKQGWENEHLMRGIVDSHLVWRHAKATNTTLLVRHNANFFPPSPFLFFSRYFVLGEVRQDGRSGTLSARIAGSIHKWCPMSG